MGTWYQVSAVTLSPKVTGEILSTIQRSEEHKELRVQQHKVKKENPLLTKSWVTRQEAVDAVKFHSTQQGKQVLV